MGERLPFPSKPVGGRSIEKNSLAEAERLLTRAESLKKGVAAYNLACLAALRGQKDEARRWLEASLAAGNLPDRGHLETDKDMDPIRGEAWFADIVKRAKA